MRAQPTLRRAGKRGGCLLVLLLSTTARAGEVTDLRLDYSRHRNECRFFDFIHTGKEGSAELLVLGGLGFNEVDLGLGKPIASGRFNASLTGYLALDDLGDRWVYPGVSYTFASGKLDGEGFLYHYLPLNGQAPHLTGGNPLFGFAYWASPKMGHRGLCGRDPMRRRLKV